MTYFKRFVLLLALLGLVAACAPKVDIEEAETSLARYVRIVIPANGIEGQTYTEVARVEFQVNQYGQVIYAKDPNTGKAVPKIARVHFSGTYSTPGQLQLMGIILPGMIQFAGGYYLQERCIDKGCGGSGDTQNILVESTNVIDVDSSLSAGGIPGCITCRR